MNYERCYFDDDLRVYYFNHNVGTDAIGSLLSSRYTEYYRLIWMTGDKSIYIDKNEYRQDCTTLCFAAPGKRLNCMPRTNPYEIMIIELHPKYCTEIPQSEQVLEFFYELDNGREMFDLSEPQNANLNVFIELLKSALFALNGRFHIETRVNAIISELCMIYESQYKEYIASTDSIPVQILDFINKNFTSNITLDSIKDKFFVSKTTIIAIVKRITGMTFKQYITKLRLNMGKDLIESGNQNAQNAALLCGFNEYSAFYKAYKKMYQMPPSSQIKNKESYYPRV